MKVNERFLKYVSFGTNSDENSDTCPSTSSQLELGKYIAEELKSIGLTEVIQDKDGYVYGVIPATKGRENDCHIDDEDDSSRRSRIELAPYKGNDIGTSGTSPL